MSETMTEADFNRQFEQEQKMMEASLVEFTVEYINGNQDPKDPSIKPQRSIELARNANEAASIYNQMGFTVMKCVPTATIAPVQKAAPAKQQTPKAMASTLPVGAVAPTKGTTYNYIKTPHNAPRCRLIVETGEVEFEIVKTIKFTECASISKKITSLLKDSEARHIKIKYSNQGSSKTKILSSFISEFMDGSNTESLAVEELLVGGIWEKATPEDS